MEALHNFCKALIREVSRLNEKFFRKLLKELRTQRLERLKDCSLDTVHSVNLTEYYSMNGVPSASLPSLLGIPNSLIELFSGGCFKI